MESRNRNTAAGLSWDDYAAAAPRSFFSLVHFLERATPESNRPGESGPASRETIRFRHDPGLGFHAADVRQVEVSGDPRRFQITTTFLGLSGTASPLPPYMVESVLFDTFEQGTQRDFLDLFHHRAISLLYRAVAKLRPAQEHRSDGLDPWLQRLLGMSGIHEHANLALQPRHLMVLIPILLKRGRGATATRVALTVILRDELPDARVEIRELAGHWLEVDAAQHTLLGARNHALGRQSILGRRVYDRRGRFAVRIGVLSRDQAARFSEGEMLLDRLRATVSLVLREPMEYDLELELDATAAQTLRLGFSGLGTARLAGFHGNETLIMRNVGKHLGVNRSLV